MKLRLLQQKDAAGMLEWMHDEEVNKYFRFRAEDMSEKKAREFIMKSLLDAEERKNFHFAITDKSDRSHVVL